ncbi:hypothetical protein BO78DRAFT_204194 [Aspergillus sclerotiicarbonarius CBS 121057]|uniref:DUF7730 domain-containing protein n=1 Tax=Aspergillus sclerotiicarbonarius (strain CBS 121057 / IBT 28362) TaxID=1448318 RepID=A0A319EJU6_ASPSB|nr:hypothetical protein BO78DRAFT_204194 [Aspergillus sclerotiicarbonarius CBS 121057]
MSFVRGRTARWHPGPRKAPRNTSAPPQTLQVEGTQPSFHSPSPSSNTRRGPRHHPSVRGHHSNVQTSQPSSHVSSAPVRGRPYGRSRPRGHHSNSQPAQPSSSVPSAPVRGRPYGRSRPRGQWPAPHQNHKHKEAARTTSTVSFFTPQRTPTSAKGKAPPKLSPFQLLPAELRLKIYAHIFEPHRIELVRQRDKDPSKHTKRVHYRLYHVQLRPRDPSTQVVSWRRNRSFLPIALPFTCRLMYCDTLCLLYSSTQFIFNTTKAMTRFFQITPKEAHAAIRHVEINQSMYSEPHLTKFRVFKVRSDWAFYRACGKLIESCPALRVLHIDFRIRDWPINLEIGEPWSLPLMRFTDYKDRLDFVNIRLQTARFNEKELKEVAKALEKRFMKPLAFQLREDERLARELSGAVRAKRVLRIV